jgi:hypothetical protein
MTTTAKLSKTQFATAVTVLGLAALSETGEVSEYAARTNGAWVAALAALVSKGVLVARRGDFLMPEGPYAGQVVSQLWYSAA